ncbi:MAG: hypothetical protein O7A04_09505, partial [Acidobacteria bacterium]|nr:hypothetical protein [Acidobacteriota bacterium]
VVELGSVVRAAGPRPILLLDPNQGAWSGVGAEVAGGLPLINCDDPERYPELFDPRNRFDASHLNHAGARLYSRLLGDLFVDILESRDP